MHADRVNCGTYEIRVLDSVRRYDVIRPNGVDPATVPSIVDLHGSGSWPEEYVAVVGALAPTPQYRNVVEGVHEARYVDANGFAAVRLVTVADAGHSWPGTRHGDHVDQFGAAGSWDASQAHRLFVHEVDLENR